jgi:hypothetical protein
VDVHSGYIAGHFEGPPIDRKLAPTPAYVHPFGKILTQRTIRDDEQLHLTTLQTVATSLGGSTADLDACHFNFTAALGSVETMLATARILEFVGVDA